MKHTLARHAAALTVATALVAFGLTLALALSSSGCTEDAIGSFTVSAPSLIACAATSITDMVPEPPFDSTPITLVQCVGAWRIE